MKQVSIFGAAIVDILVSNADARVFQTGSSPTGGIRMSYGGDALNEATVLHKLGVPVRLQTVLGRDDAGEAVLRRLEALGLDTQGVRIREDLRTSINVVLITPDGERSFLTDPHASMRQLRPEDLVIPEGTDILCLASIFVFPLLKTAELRNFFARAKAQGITVCADMTTCKNGETVAELAPALAYVDYLFPNEKEAMLLTGETTVETAADALFRAGVGTVVIKCGDRGCYVKTEGRSFWSPAEEGVVCVDTTGAGDSFVGGFLSCLAKDLPLEECLTFANQCGARAVEHVGATAWIT